MSSALHSTLRTNTTGGEASVSTPKEHAMSHPYAAIFSLIIVLMRKPWERHKIMQNIMAAEVLLFLSEQRPSLFTCLAHFLFPNPWEQSKGVCYTYFLFPLDWETDSITLYSLPLVILLLSGRGRI